MLHLVDQAFSVWHFWTGPARRFSGWYVNLQAPYRRTTFGIDNLDHEIDIVIQPEGAFEIKDDDAALTDCIRYGRFDQATADHIRRTAADLADRLIHEGIWWDPKWATWRPPTNWTAAPLPPDWSQ